MVPQTIEQTLDLVPLHITSSRTTASLSDCASASALLFVGRMLVNSNTGLVEHDALEVDLLEFGEAAVPAPLSAQQLKRQ